MLNPTGLSAHWHFFRKERFIYSSKHCRYLIYQNVGVHEANPFLSVPVLKFDLAV